MKVLLMFGSSFAMNELRLKSLFFIADVSVEWKLLMIATPLLLLEFSGSCMYIW